MERKYYNTIAEIKEAVDNGVVVYWVTLGYNVMKHDDLYLVYCPSTFSSGGKIEQYEDVLSINFFSII